MPLMKSLCMAEQIENNDIVHSETVSIATKEEDEKVYVSETTIILHNFELQDHINHKIKQDEVPSILDNIKTEFSSPEEQHDVKNDYVKIEEEGINAHSIQIEFDNGLLYCEDCQAYYIDYCIECGMLVRILNSNVSDNADNRTQDLPSNILEIQELFGRCGIFALNVIPKGVKFGPFTGLNRTECSWKLKGGKFVADKDKSKHVSWMQHINPARNISEQNLFAFQWEDCLYYESLRQIQNGEELLVYFGGEYEDSLHKNIEVDFIPTTDHVVKDAFACMFCCLGFSAKSYLAKHKTKCLENTGGEFSIEELMQCQYCKIHLHRREYFDHHLVHCCERNVRNHMRILRWNVRDHMNPFELPDNQFIQLFRLDQQTTLNLINSLAPHIHRSNISLHLKVLATLNFVGTDSYQNPDGGNFCIGLSQASTSRAINEICTAISTYLLPLWIKFPTNNNEKNAIKQVKCVPSTSSYESFNVHGPKMRCPRLYKCEQCKYRTTNKAYLKKHTHQHYHVKACKCEICNRRFQANGSLWLRAKKRHLCVDGKKGLCECTRKSGTIKRTS